MIDSILLRGVYEKILKIILIVILSLIGLLAIFITEESIRLKNNPDNKPLIVIDKIFCGKDYRVCYGEDGKYTEQYWSIGFVLKIDYRLDEISSDDNIIYHATEAEFLLFNKFILWAWIE